MIDKITSDTIDGRLGELVNELANEIADAAKSIHEAHPGMLEYRIRGDFLRLVRRELERALLHGIAEVGTNGALVSSEKGMRLVPLAAFLSAAQREHIRQRPESIQKVYKQVRIALNSRQVTSLVIPSGTCL